MEIRLFPVLFLFLTANDDVSLSTDSIEVHCYFCDHFFGKKLIAESATTDL